MINTPYKHLERGQSDMRPSVQLFIFIAIFVGVYLAGNIIGALVVMALYGPDIITTISDLKTTAPHFASAFWILQITSMTLPMFAAPVFFAYIIVKNPADYIKSNFRFSWLLVPLVFVIMFLSNPMIELLSNINQKMDLPTWLKWMRDFEDRAEKLTGALLAMKTIWQMLFNVLFVGLLTAIVEEFMFRGVLQTILERWTKNVHAAIWITAILFSAFHLEFFGFLPRVLLGALFGYFVAWSGSIWTAVWAHFINNGASVVLTYLFQEKISTVNPDNQHLFSNAAYVFSAVIMLLLLFLYRRIASAKKEVPEHL